MEIKSWKASSTERVLRQSEEISQKMSKEMDDVREKRDNERVNSGSSVPEDQWLSGSEGGDGKVNRQTERNFGEVK